MICLYTSTSSGMVSQGSIAEFVDYGIDDDDESLPEASDTLECLW